MARAAWVGMFTTALNLLPIGQLDGGHILYSFFPSRHRMVSRIVAALLLPLAYFWLGWALWAIAMLWLGRLPSDDRRYLRRLSRAADKLGWLAWPIFLSVLHVRARPRERTVGAVMKITATIITLNEERNIARAIESLRCSDEILIVDSGSTDRTVELAEKLGVRVLEAGWLGYAGAEELGGRACRATIGFFRSTPMKR